MNRLLCMQVRIYLEINNKFDFFGQILVINIDYMIHRLIANLR